MLLLHLLRFDLRMIRVLFTIAKIRFNDLSIRLTLARSLKSSVNETNIMSFKDGYPRNVSDKVWAQKATYWTRTKRNNQHALI